MKIFFFDLDGTLLVSSRFSSSRKEEEPVKDEISPSSLNGLNRIVGIKADIRSWIAF